MTPVEYERLLLELRAIRRCQRMTMIFVFGIILWLCRISFGGDIQIASQDRQRFPASAWPYLYYFGLEHLPAERQEETAKILAFTICSCTRAVIIEHQLPQQVSPTVWRIDTRQVGWVHSLPKLIRERYPYSPAEGQALLCIRADWFIQAALDTAETGNTYFELLFGKAPANLKEFLGLLEVTGKKYEHGHIEALSGVSVAGTRLVTTQPTAGRSDVWITYDSAQVAGDSDPLEHLDRTQKFDASEIIGALPKSLSATGELGHLQVYALANSAGQLQQKAPPNVVVDHHGTRGVEIRNALSCVICHEEGLRPLGINALREFIKSGAEAYADYKNQQEIERFHLAKIQKLIDRHNVDYAAMLRGINGFTPEENSEAVKRVILAYDAPLTLESAGREVGSTANELKLALAYVGRLPARLAQLAHGQAISRDSWELEYRRAKAAMKTWSTRK